MVAPLLRIHCPPRPGPGPSPGPGREEPQASPPAALSGPSSRSSASQRSAPSGSCGGALPGRTLPARMGEPVRLRTAELPARALRPECGGTEA